MRQIEIMFSSRAIRKLYTALIGERTDGMYLHEARIIDGKLQR